MSYFYYILNRWLNYGIVINGTTNQIQFLNVNIRSETLLVTDLCSEVLSIVWNDLSSHTHTISGVRAIFWSIRTSWTITRISKAGGVADCSPPFLTVHFRYCTFIKNDCSWSNACYAWSVDGNRAEWYVLLIQKWNLTILRITLLFTITWNLVQKYKMVAYTFYHYMYTHLFMRLDY